MKKVHDTSKIVTFPFIDNKQLLGSTFEGSINEPEHTLNIRSITYVLSMYGKMLKSLLPTIEALETYKQYALSQEGDSMDWQDKYLEKLDRDINDMKRSLRDTEERIAQMINQTLAEMRDRDNQRHREFLSLNQKIDSFGDSIDQKIGEMRKEIKEDRKWIIGIAITTILGIAAMVISAIIK